MKKLRLLLTPGCDRNCEGCCNRDWDLSSLPIAAKYHGYSEIMLTGGEPLLSPRRIINAIKSIRRDDTRVPIYLYTAGVTYQHELLAVMGFLQGMTLTLHEQADVPHFIELNTIFRKLNVIKGLHYPFFDSLRLNVFDGIEIDLPVSELQRWKIRRGIVWIKDCPLPIDEEFCRYVQVGA